MLLAGCGTRLEGDDLVSARGQNAAQAGTGSGTGSGTGTGTGTGGTDTLGTTGSGGATGSVTGTSGTGGTTTQGVTTGTSGSTGGTGGTTGGTTGTGATTGGSGGATGTPISIGTVGTFSGPSGAAWIAGVEAVKLWVSDINGRGGLDGHPVKHRYVDDQGDPAKHLSAVQTMVENDKVFAFVYNVTSTSESKAVLDYLRAKKVPLIGTDLSSEAVINEPTWFPQGSTGQDGARATIYGGVRSNPTKKRYGQYTCIEAPACNEAAGTWRNLARKLGLTVTQADGEVSIGQPDFTAECLTIQRERADLVAVAVDPNSMRRMAGSCARQGVRPTWLLPSAVVASTQNGDANFAGATGVIYTSPWTVSKGAGPAGLYAARQKYRPNLFLNLSTTVGWASAKLFELGASGGLGSPPSRQRLMDRLYTLRGETQGGLSPPLTFVKGKPKRVTCYFSMRFSQGQWREDNGGRHSCP